MSFYATLLPTRDQLACCTVQASQLCSVRLLLYHGLDNCTPQCVRVLVIWVLETHIALSSHSELAGYDGSHSCTPPVSNPLDSSLPCPPPKCISNSLPWSPSKCCTLCSSSACALSQQAVNKLICHVLTISCIQSALHKLASECLRR